MRIAVFSTKPYDATYLQQASAGQHDLAFFDVRLSVDTVKLAAGAGAVCAFVNDDLSAPVITVLAQMGVRLMALSQTFALPDFQLMLQSSSREMSM